MMNGKSANLAQTLDISILNQMIEPLTLQIDKVKGGQRSPIPLPIGQTGAPPGIGWSKEEIQAVEQGWLVNDWAGGGLYVATVTDSAVPPNKLEWRMYWSVAEYPERVPPTLMGSASPRLQVVQPPPQPQPQQVPMSSFPAGLPTGGIVMQQPQYAQQPQPFYVQQPQYAPQQYGAPNNQSEMAQRRLEEQLKQTQDMLFNQRLETQQKEHAAALERQQNAHAQSIARLEQQIREAAAVQARPSGPSAEIVAMQEQNRLLQARLETEARERESERRENLMREQMREAAENTRRQIEAITQQMNAQIAAITAANVNKGMDPMMTMMMEQNRNFVASLGELSRNQATQLDKFQTFMMSPRDIIAMQKDSSNGLDQLTNKISSVYGNVMDMQQRVIENAMNLNQGGSETVGLIRDGITNAKELFERYVGSKAKVEQVTQQSQAQAAIASAQATAMQAQAQVEVARIQNMPQPIQPQPAPRPIQVAPVPANANGLGGQPTGASFEEWQRARSAQQGAEVVAASPKPSPSGQPTVGFPGRTIYGRTDEQWFTPQFIDELNTLRQGVVMHIAGLHRGVIEGATVDIVVEGISQAQTQSSMMNIVIPAITELLNNDEYVKFVDVLIPDAPDNFKLDVVAALKLKLDGDDGEDDDDDDDGDDDGEHRDDVRDGSTAPAPAKQAKPTRAKRPIAVRSVPSA